MGSSASILDLIDPCGSILGEVRPSSLQIKEFHHTYMMVVQLSKEQVDCIRSLQEDPASWAPVEVEAAGPRCGRGDVWRECDAALHASLVRPRTPRLANFDCFLEEAAVDVC